MCSRGYAACAFVYHGYGVCFFFQAEDGIRDDLVTGVQTCALPIYNLPSASTGIGRIWASPVLADGKLYFVSQSKGTYVAAAKPKFELVAHNVLDKRSEERRVGKECRSRWSPYH